MRINSAQLSKHGVLAVSQKKQSRRAHLSTASHAKSGELIPIPSLGVAALRASERARDLTSCSGRAIYEVESVKEFLQACCDMIKTHTSIKTERCFMLIELRWTLWQSK